METLSKYLNLYKTGENKSFISTFKKLCDENSDYEIITADDMQVFLKMKTSNFDTTISVKNTHKYILFDNDLDSLLQCVSSVSGWHIKILKSKTRQREVVEARYAYFYLALKYTKCSYACIAAPVNRDHATVSYAKSMFYLKSIHKLINECERFIRQNG